MKMKVRKMNMRRKKKLGRITKKNMRKREITKE